MLHRNPDQLGFCVPESVPDESMCGRYTLDPTTKFFEWFKVSNRLDGLTARYNIPPSQDVPVIIRNSPNRILMMRWGLIPHWAKDENIDYKMINARAETLSERPAYRGIVGAAAVVFVEDYVLLHSPAILRNGQLPPFYL